MFPLVADVATQSMAFASRMECHLRVATWLISRLQPTDTGAAYDLIGHHYIAAESWKNGIAYLSKAADAYAESFIVPEGAISLCLLVESI